MCSGFPLGSGGGAAFLLRGRASPASGPGLLGSGWKGSAGSLLTLACAQNQLFPAAPPQLLPVLRLLGQQPPEPRWAPGHLAVPPTTWQMLRGGLGGLHSWA